MSERNLMDQLNQHESRFSGEVWQQVNTHLEANRRKHQRSQLFTIASVVVVSLMFLGLGVYSYTVETSEISDALVVSVEDHISDDEVGLQSNSDINNVSTSAEIKSNDVAPLEQTASVITNVITRGQETNQSSVSNQEFQELQSSADLSLKNNRTSVNTLASAQSTDWSGNSNLKLDRSPKILDNSIQSLNSLSAISKRQGKKLCPTFDDVAKHNFYVWTEAGAGLPFSIFDVKEHSAFSDYVSARAQTEKTLISPEGSVGVGYKLDNGLFAQAGIQVQQLREEFVYTDPESVSYQTVITIDTIVTQFDTLIAVDTSSVQVSGSRAIVHTNVHRNFNIPLIVGFQKKIRPHISASFKGGVLLNFSTIHTGRILDPDMKPKYVYSQEAASIDVYETRFKPQILLGAQIDYHINPYIDVYAGLNARYSVNSITTSDYPLTQNYLTPTINVGFNYFIRS